MTQKAVDRWGEGHAFKGIASGRPKGGWDKSGRHPHGSSPETSQWIILNSVSADQPVDDGVDSSSKHEEIQCSRSRRESAENCGMPDLDEDSGRRGVETDL